MRLSRLLLSAGLFGGPLALVAFTNTSLTPPAFAQVVKVALPAQPPAVTPAKKDDKAKPVVTDPVELDKQALTAAGMKPDDPAGLIQYLKTRTLNDADLGKIQALIKKMGGEAAFNDRIAAQDQLIQIGGQAVAPLRIASQKDEDPEIVYRAKECVRRMEKEKSLGADVTIAVIRALGRTKDPQAVSTIIGFLPLADSSLVVDTIQAGLRDAAAGADGKPNKLLVDALSDENATRRRVSAMALIEGGTPEKRIRFPELQSKFVEMAKTDKDAGVRFVLARTLVADARIKDAVEVLIDLMPDMTRGQSWQVEELLVQIAGKDAPPERCKHAKQQGTDREVTTNKAAREKARDAWKKWWATAKDKTDLAKIDLKQTLRGHFMLATQFWGGAGQQINLTEYGQDDKERERVAFQVNNTVMDVLLTDGGKVFSLEHGAAAVSVRDLSGKVTATWTVPIEKNAQRNGFQPKGMHFQPNGNLMVVHACGFAELDKDGKEVFKYTRPEMNKQPQMDVCGAVRMANGEIVLSLTTSKLLVLDEKGKEVEGRKPIQTGPPNHQKSLLMQSGENKVTLVEQQSIVEYDLKAGKADGLKLQNVYSQVVGQRLPNGNILHSDNNFYPPRIVEKTPKGEEVWSFHVTDQNQNLIKAMVR